MQCGSGIPGIRLGNGEALCGGGNLQTRMIKEDLPEAHEMGAFMEVAPQVERLGSIGV